MAMPLPLSTRQTKVLEDILARCDMTLMEENLMRPVLQRLRENLQYARERPNTSLDHYYEK